ncbi:hypothetical protein SISNIDRAFT_482000 [Sistotremastrum niveocremeum HHB9708]|uniref:Uncharacterized protein n=1 Tax=Sistotremastrum niveocremeum HHB9708 TaxID=1314777 RepID=A0A164YME4_9AGAM|nr:hypothetical protein SISNIDRAFT_482000 [Sistotremastrum niveocremeum HHB9708]
MSFTTHERLPWASLIENAVVCGGLLARPFKSGPPEPHSPNHYNSLQIVDLFAQNHAVPSSTLHLPCDFRKFTMDRGQDLLVLVRFQGASLKIVLCNLSSGELRLDIAHPIIEFQSSIFGPWASAEILGPSLAVKGRALSIVDWKAERLIVDTHHRSLHGPLAVKLISESHYVLYSCHRDGQNNIPYIQIFEVNNPNLPLVTYLLPSLCLGMGGIEIHSALSSTESPSTLRDDQIPNPAHPQILVISFPMSKGCANHIHLVVLREFFIKAVENLLSGNQIGHVIEWNSWGPQNTRTFWGSFSPRRSLHIHGFKVALVHEILDFNPLEIAKDLALRDPAKKDTLFQKIDKNSRGAKSFDPHRLGDIVTEPSMIEGGRAQFFAEDVITGLPYRRIRSPYPTHDDLFVNENLLLGIDVRAIFILS